MNQIEGTINPKAVLIAPNIEGLIFSPCIKPINYEAKFLNNFEYNQCRSCHYYVNYDELTPFDFSTLIRSLLSILEEYRHSYPVEYYSSLIRQVATLEDLESLIAQWKDMPLITHVFSSYILGHKQWLESCKLRACTGGLSVVRKGECQMLDGEEVIESGIYQVGLPSHIWLKVSDYDYDRPIYFYYLYGLIEYDDFYITPPLLIGNVWSNAEGDMGKVCWGSIRPSSNIRIAYNQFWSSFFNEDDTGTDINLTRSEQYGNDLLKRIRSIIEEGGIYELESEYINNEILRDGKFRSHVQIHIL